MDLLFWIALLTLLIYLLIALELWRGDCTICSLDSVAPAVGETLPRVSVLVAARNEALHLQEALGSLLALDYPALELIVVNDRSEDATGTILDVLAAQHPHLRALHVQTLPTGWLGKNHALWFASQRAQGELLLFTDADIVMEPSALRRAVALLQAERLDHLALTPRMLMPTAFLSMFGLTFTLVFALFTRPWKARDPQSSCHIGIGAFNLVRADAYRAIGGHQTIRLRPDDDLKLGKLLKRAGFRQELAYAPDFLGVEWYASVGEVIRGLEKNAFSGADYRIGLVLSGVIFQLVTGIWPYLALLLTSGPTRWLNAAIVLLLTSLLIHGARRHRVPLWHALGFPLALTLFCWIVLRTTTLNLLHGGITWRGTFYPLDELKKNRI